MSTTTPPVTPEELRTLAKQHLRDSLIWEQAPKLSRGFAASAWACEQVAAQLEAVEESNISPEFHPPATAETAQSRLQTLGRRLRYRGDNYNADIAELELLPFVSALAPSAPSRDAAVEKQRCEAMLEEKDAWIKTAEPLYEAQAIQLAIALRERDEARAERDRYFTTLAGALQAGYFDKVTCEELREPGEKMFAELTTTKAALAGMTRSRDTWADLHRIESQHHATFARQAEDAEQRLAAKQQECLELKRDIEEADEDLILCSKQLAAEQLAHEKTKAKLDDVTNVGTSYRLEMIAATQRAESAEQLADRLADALNKIDGLQKRWPGWSSQDLYEESQEIAGPPLEDYRLSHASRAPRAVMAATGTIIK